MSRYLLLLFMLISVWAHGQTRWETIIKANDVWKYKATTWEPPWNWMEENFNDDEWNSGNGGIGYGDGDDSTIIEPCNSVYLRKQFWVDDLSTIKKLLLNIDYDDAFVAYVNGIEVARSTNMFADFVGYNAYVTYDKEAKLYRGEQPENYPVSATWLNNGLNTLAVQVINVSIYSSDLSANVFLHADVSTTDSIYSATPEWFNPPQEFTSGNLPIIKLNTFGQSIKNDPKIYAHMGIIDNGFGNLNHLNDTFNNYDGRIGIETRGQSTQLFPKKSYSIETRDSLGENLNIPLLGLPAENDWVLYAPYTDKSLLRNAVTMELAKDLGHYSSRTAFCELFINDVYMGIYILMEKIKRDKDRVDIATLKPEDITGNELTGGYIFKVDKIDWDYTEGTDGWTSSPTPSYPNAMDIIYQYYDPKPHELLLDQKHYLKDFVSELERVLISGDFSDPDKGYNPYMNVGSFIDFMLVAELSKEVDKYRYSTYFYKTKDSNGGEVHAGPIWDFNLGYANVDYWGFGLANNGWLFENVQPHEWSIVFYWKRLMEDPYFNQLAVRRWQNLRNNLWSDQNITALFDSLTNHINEAQQRNYTRWPILGTYIWPNFNWENNSYIQEVSYFENWMFDRINWMDDNFDVTFLMPAATISDVSENLYWFDVEIQLADDYFEHSQLLKTDFNLDCSDPDAYLRDVVYIDATTAVLQVASISTQSLKGADLSISINERVLTGFETLVTNQINVSAPEILAFTDALKIYSNKQNLYVYNANNDFWPNKVEVFNKLGQLVETYPLEPEAENIITTNLPEDIYLVCIQGQDKVFTQKVFLGL